jgi:Bacterial SH3 domain
VELHALSTTTPVLPPDSAAPTAAAPPPHVNVSRGSVSACRTPSGESLRAGECGSLSGLDAIVIARLRKLGDCPAATGVSGRLNLSVHADFDHGISASLGRGHGLSSPEPMLACVNGALAGAGLAGIAHDYPKYTVAYGVTFSDSQPTAAAPAAGNATNAADGAAQVEWEVAIVRDAPKTGKVIARLQRGTALRVGSAKDGWYPVKYGDGYASDGWVYRAAIGR